ncbi:CPBP family intramembrane glutamic endopeptidase [Gracilimonas tropica]|uniref:CPBP family intramembrane glutamic endopeptidase n=1 Tax=Gracilimonas tropica TaxID=454600 RepID=UPI0003777959|nr:type II CAAX endopeptidase family protein [Gracilimonas tropica]
MTNPFFNSDEARMRAFFRIISYIFLFALLTGVPTLIPFTALEYIARGVLIFGLFYTFFRFVDRRPWDYAGLQIRSTWIKECFSGILIAATVMGLIFLAQWQTGTLEITGFAWERSFERHWLIPFSIFLIQMISVGFYEELMARGYLIPNIAEGFSFGNISPQKATLIAIFISSSIFGILHAGNPNASTTAVVNIILAGVMLAVPYVLTGRLALPIGLHFSWNFFQGGIFGFRVSGLEIRSSIIQIQQSGPDWWTGGAFGPEAGVIGIIGILLILGISLLYLKWKGVKLELAEPFRKSFRELESTPVQKS